MEYSMKEKVVLLTGGAGGIGAKTVEYFLGEGVQHVAFIDILEEESKVRQNDLRKKYGEDKVTFYKCDITQEEQLFNVFKSVVDKYGNIDIVVNNAGICNSSHSAPKIEIDTNLTGVVTSTFKGIELMHKDRGGKGGVIINISSIAAFYEDHEIPVYLSTKSAVLRFSNSMGMPDNYAKTGVRVIAVCFGLTDTPLIERLKKIDPAFVDHVIDVVNSTESLAQKAESAARCIIDVCKHGESGTTWLSISDKPVIDITADVRQAYKSLADKVISHMT